MIIKLTKISPTHHTFEYQRDGGERTILELETKTFLMHDLLHFAVETEAGLKNSFYGQLESGLSYSAISGKEMDIDFSGEAGVTERIVGPLTSIIKGGVEPKDLISGAKNMFSAYHEEIPKWFTEEFIIKVKERMKSLIGEWNGTPFGKTMTLEFK